MIAPSKLPIRDLLDRTVECTCGSAHAIITQSIDFEAGAVERLIPKLPSVLHLVMDENTRAVAGADIEVRLRAAGRTVTATVLTGGELHADAHALGAVLADLPMAAEALVAVGSGTLNDIARFIASRAKIPYAIIGTAPSMDGYASSLSPLLLEGVKLTFPAVAPSHIVGEPSVLAGAPGAMLAAGAGDLLAKLVSAVEWRMARDIDDEPYCAELVAMVDASVEDTLAAAPGLARREPNAVAALTQALTLSGLAMQMAGNSRPASGMEHHLSHFWEMSLIAAGKNPGLHGDKVGVGTLVAMDMYLRFFSQKRAPRTDNRHTRRVLKHWDGLLAESRALAARSAEVRDAIALLGGPTHPRQLGIDRAGFLDTLLHCKDVRPRYSLFNILDEFGALEDMANATAGAWYDEHS